MNKFSVQKLIAVLILGVVLLVLDHTGMLGGLKSMAWVVLSPMESAVYESKNKIVDSLTLLTFWKSGEARIKNLEQRNLELTTKLVDLQRLKEENRALREQLQVEQAAPRKMILSKVISVGSKMLVASGNKDGLKAGQTVVWGDNYVGKVVSVGEFNSLVQLPSDAAFKIGVKVGNSGVAGIVAGQYGSSVILDQVTQNENVTQGDLIITAGDMDQTPEGLTLGKVGRFISKPTDLFKTAQVESLIKNDQLSYVFVLLGQ